MERGAREFRLGKEIPNEKWSKGMNKRRMCLKERMGKCGSGKL